ncbi:MAG: nucleoside hydrolase [Clostridiales bacterium]|nr:nucleoside hydrolase [Clostridiales bacterium]
MKLVIFADYGLDDACAAVFLLQNRNFKYIDIVPIGGNVSCETALRNAKTLLAAVKADGLNIEGIRIIDSTACPQAFCALPLIHGSDGIGDILTPAESPVPVLSFDKWLPTLGVYKMLSLGPATVPVQVLEYAPCLLQGEIVIMGGCTHEEPNYGAYEFNHGLDVEAFSKLLRYPHVCATLDTCRAPAFNAGHTHKEGSSLFARLVNRSVVLANARHAGNCYIYDLIAAYALVYPNRFTIQSEHIGNDAVRELHTTETSCVLLQESK